MLNNNRKNTIRIGTFLADKQGVLHGRIYGFGFGVTPVMFEPQTSKDGREYFRLIADPAKNAYEIGAAFPRKMKDGTAYHSVSIDSPMLPGPINAGLFLDRDGGTFNLVWNRKDEENKDLKAEATVNVNVQPQHQAQTTRPMNGPQPS